MSDERLKQAQANADARHAASERLKTIPVEDLTDAELDLIANCRHVDVSLPRRRKVGANVAWYKQCLTCGRSVGSAVPAAKVQLEPRNDFDVSWESIAAKVSLEINKRIQKAHDRERAENNRDWWAWYNAYLASPEWAARRQAVMERDGWTCRACGMARATQAHHLTYAHVGCEPLFDLVAVCAECHDAITEMDRAKR